MKSSNIKTFIGIAIGVIVLLVIYIMFIKPDTSGSSATLVSSSQQPSSSASNATNQQTATPAPSGEHDALLRILNSLKELRLDDAIFFNPAFSELRDISIPLIKEGNAGRRNPFAPIGNDPVVIVPVQDQLLIPSSQNQTSSEQDTVPSGGMFGL